MREIADTTEADADGEEEGDEYGQWLQLAANLNQGTWQGQVYSSSSPSSRPHFSKISRPTFDPGLA
jgi:hypothetical protein